VSLDLDDPNDYNKVAGKDFVVLLKGTHHNEPKCFKASMGDYEAVMLNYRPLIAETEKDNARVAKILEDNIARSKEKIGL